MTSKVIQGHIRPLLCQNYSSTFVYGPILMKICMNAIAINIMKTPFLHKRPFYEGEVCDFFYFKTF